MTGYLKFPGITDEARLPQFADDTKLGSSEWNQALLRNIYFFGFGLHGFLGVWELTVSNSNTKNVLARPSI